ncbi:MAG: TonB-dependent receptor [Bacteroidales bacterium]|nr:TonB-dependent receptor [Bacteroidales bacterium]
MKHLLLLFTLLIFSFLPGHTQELNQNIRGKIVDKDSKTPLVGATVILLGTDPLVASVSGSEGDFVLENVAVGRQSLKVSYIGYHELIFNVFLVSGKEIVLNIELEEKVEVLDDVVVKAYNRKDQPINEMSLISTRSFTIEETERFAGSLGDPARMVANYAGVMTHADSRNDIIIRGNSPSGVLWRLDGIEVPNPNHFGALGTTGGPVSMINNNLLANSDFLTGAFSAEYGNALSGAFDLRMRSGNHTKTSLLVRLVSMDLNWGAEGPFIKGKKASYLANYRYSTLAFMHLLGFGTGTGSAVPYY